MTHPVLSATASIDEALTAVADVNPAFMQTGDKQAALVELSRLETRLAELRLRILAGADDVAAETADRQAATWLAHRTRTKVEDARADQRLAAAIDRRWSVLGDGLRDGAVNLAQARVISRALDELPDGVPADVVARAEQSLVGYAADFSPRQLVRLGRRIVEVVAPEIADEHEARLLAAMEQRAARATRLSLRRAGDGTTRISGLVPDAIGTRLATYLEAFTSPRCSDTEHPREGDPVTRLPYPRRLGDAFCRLLEAIDPTRLPLHGGDATTVVVTIDHADLVRELATADLLGSTIPGDDRTAGGLTAGQARRLACTAGILPMVLDGDSVPLDLGRTRRLYDRHQRKAMQVRDRTCRAEGCDVPATWCEAHHWRPWSRGGATDLADGGLLCHHHHQRAHDTGYRHERLSNGDVRFHRRR